MVASRIGFRYASRDSFSSRESTESVDDDDDDEEGQTRKSKERSPPAPCSFSSAWRLICLNVVSHEVTAPARARTQRLCGVKAQIGIVVLGFTTLSWLLTLALTEEPDEALTNLRAGGAYGLVAFAARQLVLAPCADLLKYPIYRYVGKLRDESVAEARGPRKSWSDETSKEMEAEYGDHAVRVVDALTTRVCHLLETGLPLLVYFPYLIHEQRVRVWAFAIHAALNCLMSALLLPSDGWLAATAFARCRIGDGVNARLHALMSAGAELAFIPTALLLMMVRIQPKWRDLSTLAAFVLQPYVWGGVASELVGTLCGRLNLELSGDGKIQWRKSIEGLGACFAATFVACAVVAASRGFPPAGAFTVGQITLCSYVALATTLIDAFAWREVGGALMVLATTAIVVFVWWYEFDAWMAQNDDLHT